MAETPMGRRRSLAWSPRHMRAIFRLYLPHVRYRCANIDRQVESNGLPSRWKSKFMVGPTVLASPLMEFKDVGIYPQKRTATGLNHVYGPLAYNIAYMCVSIARVFTNRTKITFFHCLLHMRYGNRVDWERRIMYTQSLRMSYGKLDRRIV